MAGQTKSAAGQAYFQVRADGLDEFIECGLKPRGDLLVLDAEAAALAWLASAWPAPAPVPAGCWS